ncbi:NAD(P)H-dependent glycerol-3-phosphate dehydrogenase [Paenibacillus yanchengensis]|uniref:Glycerol-3-phosphate dehydrogenase [NAD(P)+] n=1 Tax=Paenibacillus yanchengensis TaxID=2035833 RepID=A0ABW4YJZ4_9BACL
MEAQEDSSNRIHRRVTVLAAGSWGTALAMVLAENGFQVMLWTRSEEHAAAMNKQRKNEKYLQDVMLPNNITATSSLEEAIAASELVLFVSPSAAMRQVAQAASPYIKDEMLIVHATKGFEADTLKPMSIVLAEELQRPVENIVVLSGPSHAEEVVRRLPTTVVVAAGELVCAERAQDAFINTAFRVYTNQDVAGVEIAGALKNIIALGAGLSDGLQYGDNARAALMTRGLAEIVRLGVQMGANPLTFAGLAGVGDLIVTCTSKHSRNWRAGYKLAQGESLSDVLHTMGMVVEGVKTTRATYQLAEKYQVEMPITTQLYEVLFNGKQPKLAVEALMGRIRTNEIEQF